MTEPVATPDSAAPAPTGHAGMTRERATLTHFILSITVFVIVVVPLLFLWYPPPLFFADGGWNVIKIAYSVDIGIGPLMTLVVFKSGKKGLKFDLGVIATLQIAALLWGVHLMYQERPVLLVFADDRFTTVTMNQLAASKRPLDELLKLGNERPVRVLVKLPQDPTESLKIKMAQLQEGTSIIRLTERYEGMTPENLKYVYDQSLDMDAFIAKRPQNREPYETFLQDNKLDPKDLAFVPLICRYDNVIIALRRSDSSIAGTLNITPPDYNLFSKSHKTGAK